MPDGKVFTEELNMSGFIILGRMMYSSKDNPEEALMVPEACSTFTHRADIVDLMEKFKFQLYLSSVARTSPAADKQ